MIRAVAALSRSPPRPRVPFAAGAGGPRAGRVPRPGRGALPLAGSAGEAAGARASSTSPPTSTGCAPSSTSAGERVFAADKRFELLYPLIEITTTLDPRMEIAYRYGAAFLAEPQPIGAGRPDLGVAVLERGVANNPSSWRLRQELGFFHFIYLQRRREARPRDPRRGVEDPGGRVLAEEPGRRGAGQGRRARHGPPHVAADGRAVGRRMQGERARSSAGASTRLDAADALDAGRGGVRAPRRAACREPRRAVARPGSRAARSWIRPASRSYMMPDAAG